MAKKMLPFETYAATETGGSGALPDDETAAAAAEAKLEPQQLALGAVVDGEAVVEGAAVAGALPEGVAVTQGAAVVGGAGVLGEVAEVSEAAAGGALS